jgi:hypothetical protein
VADVHQARQAGKLAVSLNLQGSNNLGRDLNLVQLYYDLGVRQLLLVYNHKNAVGDGCHERTDGGLSRYGIELIQAMNAVGMIVDCSHGGPRTTMEAIEVSNQPVMFTHSNPKALWRHDRNITDEQAKACAARGGLVGAVGVGIFMGDNDASTETYFRHIDYWATLVESERAEGKRYLGRDGPVEWLAAFAPSHQREVWGLVPGTGSLSELDDAGVEGLAAGLARVLSFYEEIGAHPFTLAFLSSPEPGRGREYALQVRACSRPPLRPLYVNYETWFGPMFGGDEVHTEAPEAYAARLRERW